MTPAERTLLLDLAAALRAGQLSPPPSYSLREVERQRERFRAVYGPRPSFSRHVMQVGC